METEKQLQQESSLDIAKSPPNDDLHSAGCQQHQGKDVLKTECEFQEEEEVDVLTLTLPHRPGTDLSSKNLLRDKKMKNVVVSAVVGNGINGNAYHVSHNEHADGRKSHIIYLPCAKCSDALPPVVVEIQHKLDHNFMSRAMRYCLAVFDEVKVLPILVVFNVNGFSSKYFCDSMFTKAENSAFYTSRSDFWAQKVFIFNADSIADSVNSILVQHIVALAFFFTQRQRHLLALEEYDDPNVQDIYKTAYRVFSLNRSKENDNTQALIDVCDKVSLQFQKIVDCAKRDTPGDKRKLLKYAEDGVLFGNSIKRRCLEEVSTPDVTPIEDTSKSADLSFVETHMKKSPGKMKWVECYEKGRASELFGRYSSHLTLKMAFHRRTL
ncbi:hypothetical protein EC973_004718 [Apophysomyces ossiformis]|uniref:Uncharacterized protein n=1 Tax=Apophysomyces ossiformis TaxID=679940 RepID=A0A8H7BGK3_9FUNG|nr:hypothetical protein EC973_004718 [Apophysomyces ossiformis]